MTSAGIRGSNSPIKLPLFLRWLRRQEVDLIQTWMYHADLVGGLYAIGGGSAGRVERPSRHA